MFDVWDAVLEELDPQDTGPSFDGPADVARLIDPATVDTPALDLITSRLVEASTKRGGRLMISMPCQEGKTTRASRDFPLWLLTQDTDLRVTLASYNADRAADLGRQLRNAISDNPELGLTLSQDQAAADTFRLAGSKGGVRARGVGGSLTGFPSDVLIIDDPHKDLAGASSRAEQKAVWAWWTSAVLTRITPQTPIIIIATRWHEKDLIGQILESESGSEWDVLNIPAQAESSSDPLGRKPGEYLTSARGRTPEDWERTKRAVGSRVWTALYQGRPSPEDGDIFKRDGIRFYDAPFDPAGWRFVQSWDLAFTSSDTSDYVVGQVWAKKGNLHRLVDQRRGRWSFTETIEQMIEMTSDWPNAATKLVEAKANGSAAIDTLKRKGITGVTPITPRESKVIRATATTPLWEAGDVELPHEDLADWVNDVVDELVSFPNGAHDDTVDAATQALNYLSPANAVGPNRSYSF